MLTLTAKAIHHNGEHTEVQRTFDTNEVSIGRQAECDMALPDPDRRISRMQARILHADGQYVVSNASTSNPMYVNGVELAPGSGQVLGDGDELRAGSYAIVVSLGACQDRIAESENPPQRAQFSPDLQPHSPAMEQKASEKLAAAADLQPAASKSDMLPANPVPQPESLRHGESNAVDTPANTLSRTNSLEQEDAASTIDPLLGVGTSANTANANPFADLLTPAPPVNSSSRASTDTRETGALPSPAASGDLHDKQVSEKPLSANRGNSQAAPAPEAKLPLAEREPLSESANPLSAKQGLPLASRFDPNDPFGDLLAQALPVGSINETASGMTSGTALSPLSQQDMDAASSKHAAQNVLAAREVPRQKPEDTQSALENPLALQAKKPVDAPHAQKRFAESTLPGLAGDPFSDLMGASIESHMANAPPFDPVSQRKDYIPMDFNPLATGGVAQRNSSDPLTLIGPNARGLADVTPEATIDSIYNPGSESPVTLVVDPLQSTQAHVLRVGQSLDPLKVFANDGSGLMPGTPEADTGGSVRDDAREMVASFRAPVARIDSDMLPDESAQDGQILGSPPVPVLSDKPVPANIPVDAEINLLAPASTPLSPTVDKGQDTPRSSPSADLSGANSYVAEAKSGQGATLPDSVTLLAPKPPAASSPVAAKPSDDSPPSSSIGKSKTQDTQELIAAFKRGIGIEEFPLTSMTPELMETIGLLLQVAVQGTVSLLAARTAIKQEIHLSVTVINPKSNNPLKFLPDGQTALLQMLLPKMPGFMMPVDAMKEAFDDLQRHQTAIAAGTQATIEALFRRFDPDAIESRYPKNGIGEKLSQTKHHARLWNTYADQYRLIKEEIKDDFFKRLGVEFHDAYNREYDHAK